MRLPRHTPDTAADKAAALLGGIIECHGSAGTMAHTLAGSASTRTTSTFDGTALGQV